MQFTASLTAGGNIPVCFPIKMSAAADFTALAVAAATDVPEGIAIDAQHGAPIPNASAYAAVSGDFFNYFGPGMICTVQVSSTAGVAANDLLIFDGSGPSTAGVTTASAVSSSSLVWLIAKALQAANAGEKVACRVLCVPYGA